MSPRGRGKRKIWDSYEGRGGGPGKAGPGGECECTACGYRMPHEVGKPCTKQPCPKCGAQMIRRG
jgi:hypothetical protein